MKVAVIGIGSNSVRMLLGAVEDGVGRRLCRERAGTRLFAGLDGQKRLQPEAMAKTAAAVSQMADSARKAGAERLHLFATSATRDATNGAEFTALLRTMAGLETEILSGGEEARLSYLGASEGHSCGVMDIGGGSTELVVGHDGAPAAGVSCQLGAVRLFRQLPLSSAEDVPAIIRYAREEINSRLDALQAEPLPGTWVGTGGTFTALAALLRGTHWTDRACMHGTLLTRVKVMEQTRKLAGMTVQERLQLPGLQPSRADICVHGFCILLACMEALSLDCVRVSEYGNLEGYLKKEYSLTSLT